MGSSAATASGDPSQPRKARRPTSGRRCAGFNDYCNSKPSGQVLWIRLRRKLAAVYSKPALPTLGSNRESGADACCLQVGALALAGCTQQALTKLKMFSLMTSEPRRSIPCRTSLLEAGHYLSKGGRVGACAALTHPHGEAAPCTMKGRRAESPAHGKSQCLRGGSAP